MILILTLAACVLDRTGQSATTVYQRELSAAQARVRDLESVGEDVGRRVAQLEEVTRARGQEDILKMETVEELRGEVAKMRGEFETLDHDYRTFETAALGTQTDVDARLLFLETRVAALEKSLGLKPPRRPDGDALLGAAVGPAPPPSGDPVVDPPAAEVTATPEEVFGLIAQHLEAGSGEAARAVARRFVEEHPGDDRVPEAYYRIAESHQNAREFKLAATAFQVVLDKAPNSTWAPWALLRQGECFDSLGRNKDAAVFYCDVVHRYPKSKAAKEAKDKCP
ncbi:MAG: tetratricopeptide repeat protein [Myxococcales bacterium]|nr:tetratricopeptide repeat protein [Myxococcales bacterium]